MKKIAPLLLSLMMPPALPPPPAAAMPPVTAASVRRAYQRQDYPLSQFNVFGVRNTQDRDSDRFNDVIGVLFKENGKWELRHYPGSVDPGLFRRVIPMNSKGVSIIVPGFYKDVYGIGRHTDYIALRQMKPMRYWRDNTRDGKLHMTGPITRDIVFTNLHYAFRIYHDDEGVQIVYDNSSGCCVIQKKSDFDAFMKLAYAFRDKGMRRFSFALFTEDQLAPDDHATRPEKPGPRAARPEKPGPRAARPEKPGHRAARPEKPGPRAARPEKPGHRAARPEKPTGRNRPKPAKQKGAPAKSLP